LPVTATVDVDKNSLPLSVIFRLMRDKNESGRNLLYSNGQDNIGGDIKLRKGGLLNLSRELEIDGQKTKFMVWNVTNKARAFPLDRKDFMVSREEDGRFVFNKTGKFKILMSNEAVYALRIQYSFLGIAPAYRKIAVQYVGSGEITVE
jgi:hypothetical protein